MARQRGNKTPRLRFTKAECAELMRVYHEHNNTRPSPEVIEELARMFSEARAQRGKRTIQPKKVRKWFLNKQYGRGSKKDSASGSITGASISALPPASASSPLWGHPVLAAPVRDVYVPMPDVYVPMPVSVPQLVQGSDPIYSNVPQPTLLLDYAPQPEPEPVPASALTAPAPMPASTSSVLNPTRGAVEFEALSSSDGVWHTVASLRRHRCSETGEPEVLIRFACIGREDEWVKVCRHLRPRCEAPRCASCVTRGS